MYLSLLATTGSEGIMDGLGLTIVGMGVVFLALIAIWGMLILIGEAFGKEAVGGGKQDGSGAPTASTPAPAPVASAPAPPAPEPAPANGTIPPEILAAITAAVAVAVQQPFRIRRVRFSPTDNQSAWASQGRQAIHASHRLRKGSR